MSSLEDLFGDIRIRMQKVENISGKIRPTTRVYQRAALAYAAVLQLDDEVCSQHLLQLGELVEEPETDYENMP